jgi:hypothetical protein
VTPPNFLCELQGVHVSFDLQVRAGSLLHVHLQDDRFTCLEVQGVLICLLNDRTIGVQGASLMLLEGRK